MNVLIEDDIRLLNSRLPCTRVGCKGLIPEVSLRVARAFAEYSLRTDPFFRFTGECSDCKLTCYYTYSDILNRIPAHLRPASLPRGHFDALVLVPFARLPSGEVTLLGERVLIEQLGTSEGGWSGRLLTTSALAPDVGVGARLAGTTWGSFRVCDSLAIGGGYIDLPVSMPKPGTTDSGVFIYKTDSPDLLLSSQPFCSNQSCCHIAGVNYTQFRVGIEAQKDVFWFLGAKGVLVVDCQRCGTSTVIDDSAFARLYRL
jgi:hypothetical protein